MARRFLNPWTSLQIFNDVWWHQPAMWVLCTTELSSYGRLRQNLVSLNTDGTVVAYYVGHGAHVAGISLCGDDPHAFLTACFDGYPRLDVIRHPLPVLILNVENEDFLCLPAAYARTDGILGGAVSCCTTEEQC